MRNIFAISFLALTIIQLAVAADYVCKFDEGCHGPNEGKVYLESVYGSDFSAKSACLYSCKASGMHRGFCRHCPKAGHDPCKDDAALAAREKLGLEPPNSFDGSSEEWLELKDAMIQAAKRVRSWPIRTGIPGVGEHKSVTPTDVGTFVHKEIFGGYVHVMPSCDAGYVDGVLTKVPVLRVRGTVYGAAANSDWPNSVDKNLWKASVQRSAEAGRFIPGALVTPSGDIAIYGGDSEGDLRDATCIPISGEIICDDMLQEVTKRYERVFCKK